MQNTAKKGELTINMIVIAILALVVLVVILVIFGKQSSNFLTGLNSCQSKQGICTTDTRCSQEKGQVLSFKCDKESDPVCCYLACESNKGSCKPKSACISDGKANYIPYTECDDKGEVCCLN